MYVCTACQQLGPRRNVIGCVGMQRGHDGRLQGGRGGDRINQRRESHTEMAAVPTAAVKSYADYRRGQHQRRQNRRSPDRASGPGSPETLLPDKRPW